MNNNRLSTYQTIYETVRRIPWGRVSTYGQIAGLAGMPGQARLVGYALHSLAEDTDVPWHRVINAKGGISQLPDPDACLRQKMLLQSEGIRVDEKWRINLELYGWKG
ncbi:MGMT family protein [bacterium]|nr:MGMT family protein [bacterium]